MVWKYGNRWRASWQENGDLKRKSFINKQDAINFEMKIEQKTKKRKKKKKKAKQYNKGEKKVY